MKAEALDRTVCWTGLGEAVGLALRQTAGWMLAERPGRRNREDGYTAGLDNVDKMKSSYLCHISNPDTTVAKPIT